MDKISTCSKTAEVLAAQHGVSERTDLTSPQNAGKLISAERQLLQLGYPALPSLAEGLTVLLGRKILPPQKPPQVEPKIIPMR